MEKRREDQERKEQPDKRSLYAAPKLKVFGPVGTLTQSETFGGSVGSGGAGPKKP